MINRLLGIMKIMTESLFLSVEELFTYEYCYNWADII